MSWQKCPQLVDDLLLRGVRRGGLVFSLRLVGPVGCSDEGDVSDHGTCCLGTEFSPKMVTWRGEGCRHSGYCLGLGMA